ncbi:MAG: bifunctional adenosylcobinamide kinase/adenosylcobinamide-phosphate guanylyltransferase [Hyphomicrobiaceae bacterium]|nr:bifunctional adenosylcobinamide kinase/adenosylcobinamide-phosphate guanylyltransferase [Hyphomicrobiaceae bacterium]
MAELTAPRLTFLLGGARSGKSLHAETLISALPAPWIYIATAQAFDDEMSARIKKHQMRRKNGWQTIETPLDLAKALQQVPAGAPILVDCLTLWLSNHILRECDLAHECDALLIALQKPRGPWFVVANETGMGIVPENALARRFRDAAGMLNQKVAALADEVILMTAGLPIQLKNAPTGEKQ